MTPLGLLVAAGCTYETASIVYGRTPTLTRIVHTHRHRPVVAVVVAGALLWLTWHLLWEE